MIKYKGCGGKYLFWFITAVLTCIFFFPAENVWAHGRVQDTDGEIVIVIDPGHGGENQGTIENGFQEKSMTLITALSMYRELSQYENTRVYLTREDDRDLTLKQRAELAKQVDADFLFSIHYNASPNHNLFGSEVWISSKAPYNAYGYQFGYAQMNQMQDMGLFLRGIKTRLNDKGTDYYGIIRESAALEVPAVIIEHCHVDEERDVPYCDENGKLEAFGAADARAVADYFGLKRKDAAEGDSITLPEADPDKIKERTLKDETPPDICILSLNDADYDTGQVELGISAADYDSMLLYYDYSIDGGVTFSPLQPWPGSDAMSGAYQDSFSFSIQIPSGVLPRILVRAYNLFDGFTISNELTGLSVFRYGEEEALTEEMLFTESMVSDPTDQIRSNEGSESSAGEEKQDTVSLLTFLKICLICSVTLFLIVLFSQLLNKHLKRKKRHQRRKQDGQKRNHPK